MRAGTSWPSRPAADSPIVYFCGAETFRAAILAPFALRADVGEVWRANRGAILGVGALSPLAYVLVLFALTRAPISLVAPVRESSVVLGAILGAGVLKEGQLSRRILAASAIAVGIAALALS
jgi:drug/metabolite transporter (DMT)-like permease